MRGEYRSIINYKRKKVPDKKEIPHRGDGEWTPERIDSIIDDFCDKHSKHRPGEDTIFRDELKRVARETDKETRERNKKTIPLSAS